MTPIVISSHKPYLMTGVRNMIELKVEIRVINFNDLTNLAPIFEILGKSADGNRLKGKL